MSPFWLILIVPLSVAFGFLVAALCHSCKQQGNDDDTLHVIDSVRKDGGGL